MIHQLIDTKAAEDVIERRRDSCIVAVTVAASAIYATLRYNVFKHVPWSDWPHYVGNKILALSALILIAVSVARLIADHPRPIRRLMAIGSAFALTHTLVSLGLFQASYFDRFFAGEKLSLAGGTSLMLASLAMALLNWGRGRRGSATPASSAGLLGVIAFVSGLHAALPSLATWIEPAKWPGKMPPITLISFLLGLAALVGAYLIHKRRAP